LLVDGKLVAAAEEERFSGKKHTGDFPISAIRFCLSEAGISNDDVDEIAHGFDYAPIASSTSAMKPRPSAIVRCFPAKRCLTQIHRDLPGFADRKVHSVGHHLAHAASAALTSGWDECLVVVNDAMGETESLSVYDFHDGELEKICTIGANNSIGILYSLVTLHLGFDFNSDEYKIMGLAPYGDPARFRSFFEQSVELREDGTIRIPILKLNHSREERECYTATRAYLTENLILPRHPASPVTRVHEDVAAALQECLEQVVLHVCGHFAEKTGLRRLALWPAELHSTAPPTAG
jgi:carbamoyltransferase